MAGWINESWVGQTLCPQLPLPVQHGCHPTLGEVKRVLAGLDGFDIEYRASLPSKVLDAYVTEKAGPQSQDMYTVLWIRSTEKDGPQPKDDSDRVAISFHKGWPELAVRIAGLLAETCGTLVLIETSSATPLVISSREISEDLIGMWLNYRKAS